MKRMNPTHRALWVAMAAFVAGATAYVLFWPVNR